MKNKEEYTRDIGDMKTHEKNGGDVKGHEET